MRWSDADTWGVDFLPQDGDLIHVPKGQILYVDQSTPDLLGIVVEGILAFADEQDLVMRAGFITINEGIMYAGSENAPYNHDLTIELTGSYKSRKQPIFGDKVIGCQECYMSIHGKNVHRTWTLLSISISVGDTTIEV